MGFQIGQDHFFIDLKKFTRRRHLPDDIIEFCKLITGLAHGSHFLHDFDFCRLIRCIGKVILLDIPASGIGETGERAAGRQQFFRFLIRHEGEVTTERDISLDHKDFFVSSSSLLQQFFVKLQCIGGAENTLLPENRDQVVQRLCILRHGVRQFCSRLKLVITNEELKFQRAGKILDLIAVRLEFCDHFRLCKFFFFKKFCIAIQQDRLRVSGSIADHGGVKFIRRLEIFCIEIGAQEDIAPARHKTLGFERVQQQNDIVGMLFCGSEIFLRHRLLEQVQMILQGGAGEACCQDQSACDQKKKRFFHYSAPISFALQKAA